MAKVGENGFRAALMAGAGISLLWAAPAFAQQRQHFDLPAGDAAQRVRAVATPSRTQVIAPNADLAGVKTRAVRGDYSAAEALRLMLDGTGLALRAQAGFGVADAEETGVTFIENALLKARHRARRRTGRSRRPGPAARWRARRGAPSATRSR